MGDPVRIEARVLADLIQGWTDGEAPLYRLLADGIARLIGSGDLPAGATLPSERSLALALPAARGTVVSAYGLLVAPPPCRRKRSRSIP